MCVLSPIHLLCTVYFNDVTQQSQLKVCKQVDARTVKSFIIMHTKTVSFQSIQLHGKMVSHCIICVLGDAVDINDVIAFTE